jgi:hypothetical protein
MQESNLDGVTVSGVPCYMFTDSHNLAREL